MARGVRNKDLLDNPDVVAATGFKIRYAPRGGSLEAFHCREDELLVVGPKGTGKSLGILQKHHLMLCKYPGAKGFMARKTRASMTNSCLDMYQKMVIKPPDRVHFHKQDQQFNYPNGSIYAVIGLDNVDRLNSSEWDFGFIQEATEATENDWEIAGACIRHGRVPYQQLAGDANPDKPTHWLKVRCDKGLTRMIRSTHEDNPKFFNPVIGDWTPEGQRYLGKLKRLSGVRYQRLYLGEWAAAEGIVYDKWDPHVHLISRQTLPIGWEDWPHYWSIDFGFVHPFVWQDWMESPDGSLYLNREIYRTRMLVEDVTREIMALNDGLPYPRAVVCDHDAEGRAVFERHSGMLTLPAYKMIKEGVEAVQTRLLSRGDSKAGIFLLRDALVSQDEELVDAGKPYSTATEFDGYVWDESRNKLVNSRKEELPKDLDNHGMDALRYVIAFVDSLADDPADTEITLYNDEDLMLSPY